jgi:hypothetical protein
MIDNTTLITMFFGILSLVFGLLAAVVYLATHTDPKPPRAGLMREEYRK